MKTDPARIKNPNGWDYLSPIRFNDLQQLPLHPLEGEIEMEVMNDLPLSAVTVSQRTLFKVAEFVQLPEFSYLSQNGLRHLIFNSENRFSASGDVIPGNGLMESGALIRIGRRLLIDADRFRNWTRSQRAVPQTSAR